MPRYLFITGKLAEPVVRDVLKTLSSIVGFEYELLVLNITVAALMTPEWVMRRLEKIPDKVDHIYVPGACQGDWSVLEKATGVSVTPGPQDVRDLPELFGKKSTLDYGKYSIEIIAEINHAPSLTREHLLEQAKRFKQQGADVIDLGCIPGNTWQEIGDAVRSLKDEGFRVSLDTFNVQEAGWGCESGAELVLSVNSVNREASVDWGCEVVAIPDQPHDLKSLHETIEFLASRQVPFRIDPVLEPIGMGFGASLLRYAETRKKYSAFAMMMGIGNLTELTEVDSAGVNLILMALCQEWQISSVLTTAVANHARSSVIECDIARRLAYHSVVHQRIPKKVDDRLLLLRERKLREFGNSYIDQLASEIKDRNYRLFAETGTLHALNGESHLASIDPFLLFDELLKSDPSMEASHAFYLGYELCKAKLALQLGKNYVQDQALRWGYLTEEEISHRARKGKEGDKNATS